MNEELLISITANLDNLSKGMEQVKAQTKDLDKNLQATGKGVDKTADGFKRINKSSALMQGLSKATGGLSDNLIDVVNGLKLSTVGARAFSTALIATGIGALVVALGLVVAYWDDIVKFATGYDNALGRQLEKQKEKGDAVAHELDLLNKSDATLELQGKTQIEINKLKQEAIEKVIEQRRQELELAKTQLENLSNYAKNIGDMVTTVLVAMTLPLRTFTQFMDDTFGSELENKLDGVITKVIDFSKSFAEVDEATEDVRKLEKQLASLTNNLSKLVLEAPKLITPIVASVEVVEGLAQGIKILGEGVDKTASKIANTKYTTPEQIQGVRDLMAEMETLGMVADAIGQGVGEMVNTVFAGIYDTFKTGNAIMDGFLSAFLGIFETIISKLLQNFIIEKIISKGQIASQFAVSNANAIAGASLTASLIPGGVFALPGLIASAVGTVAGAFAGLTAFAGGGFSGDRNIVRVNSNELILNPNQQSTLFNMLRGTVPSSMSGTSTGTNTEPGSGGEWKVRGSDLVLVLDRANRKSNRFG